MWRVGSLRDRIEREGHLPVDEALRLATQVSRAIDYAHRQGVIHRDIKPGNILLTKDGDPLVADFGIARALNPSPDSRVDLTATGAPIGTPAYMAPEQASGDEPIDARADQYGLAITLYEMLVGRLPFRAQSTVGMIAHQLGGAPSVRLFREEVPESVDQALAQAMAIEPDQRFDSMAGSAGRWATSPPPGAAPRGRPVAPRCRLGMLLVLAAAGAGLFPAEPGGAGGMPVIAVLPFDYQGDSADAYFADGVADEVRSKLTRIGGVTVIARASSIEYQHSSKRPEQIARELGADTCSPARCSGRRRGAGRAGCGSGPNWWR